MRAIDNINVVLTIDLAVRKHLQKLQGKHTSKYVLSRILDNTKTYSETAANDLSKYKNIQITVLKCISAFKSRRAYTRTGIY